MDPQSPATGGRSGDRDLSRQNINHNDWKNLSSVKAWIPNLPAGTTTYDIHKNISRFGKVEWIQITETREGNFGRGATVTFK